jgi:effector-binding domain-containing protein
MTGFDIIGDYNDFESSEALNGVKMMSTQTLPCEVIDYPIRFTLGIRARAAQKDLPIVIPQLIQKVAGYFTEIGKPQTEPSYVAYFNEDMDNLDVEIGFITPEKLTGKGEIVSGTIGGSKAVSCMYIGAYSLLYQGHEAAHRFVAENGYQHAGAAYEIYLSDPARTPESELKTQVIVMIKG